MIPISIGGVTLLSGVYVCKHANLRYSLFSWKHAGEIKKFSTSSVFISLASFLIYQTPAFFICIHRGMDKVIEISYPVMIFLTASNLMAALQMTLTPKAAKYTLAKDWRVLSELMRLNIRRYYVISMIPLVIFYFLGELTLRKWLPTSTVSGALVHSIYLFTLVLLAGIVLQSFARMALSILIGAGDVTDAARLEFSVSGMGVLLYLCCALVPGSGHGLYILSMLLIIVIRSFIVYPLYLNRFYKVNVNDLARVFVTLPVKQVGGSVP
jgi:O-antigen/teichoic acid export membrane protein